MHRGKPLYLNEERYAALTHMVKELLLALLILFPHFFFNFFYFFVGNFMEECLQSYV